MGPSVLCLERLEIGKQVGDIVLFENEGRHLHRMANLDPALEGSGDRPGRQAIGSAPKARGVGMGRDTVIEGVTRGAICLRKCFALRRALREIVCFAISYAGSKDERGYENQQSLEHGIIPLPTQLA